MRKDKDIDLIGVWLQIGFAATAMLAVVMLSGCGVSVSGEVYPVDERGSFSRTHDRPFKCRFGNFEGCNKGGQS